MVRARYRSYTEQAIWNNIVPAAMWTWVTTVLCIQSGKEMDRNVKRARLIVRTCQS
jgi:hypothetical protein